MMKMFIYVMNMLLVFKFIICLLVPKDNMCSEDYARYGPLQDQIRSRYCQGGSSS